MYQFLYCWLTCSCAYRFFLSVSCLLLLTHHSLHPQLPQCFNLGLTVLVSQILPTVYLLLPSGLPPRTVTRTVSSEKSGFWSCFSLFFVFGTLRYTNMLSFMCHLVSYRISYRSDLDIISASSSTTFLGNWKCNFSAIIYLHLLYSSCLCRSFSWNYVTETLKIAMQ